MNTIQHLSFTPISSASSINAKDSDQIYLIKYPKTISLAELSNLNVPINVPFSSKTITKSGKRLSIISDIGEKQRMCSVVGKGLSNCGIQEFSGILSFSEDITSEEKTDLEMNLTSLLLPEQAYKPVSQIPELRVINVPVGSVSTVEQIQSRASNLYPLIQNKRQRDLVEDSTRSEKDAKEKKKKRKKESKHDFQ